MGAIATLAVLLSAPGLARGDTAPRPLVEALSITGGRCFARDEIAAQIAAWLGRDTLSARLEVTLDEVDGGAHFVLRRDGEVLGQRTIISRQASCDAIRSTVALAIAVSIDATILETLGVTAQAPPSPAPARSPEPPPPPSPPSSVMPSRESPRAVAPPPSRAARFQAGAEIGVLAGIFPSPALQIAPWVSFAPVPSFVLRLGGLGVGGAQVEVLGGGAKLRIAAAGLDACSVTRLGPARVDACFGGIAGALTASGFNFDSSHASTSAWFALEGRFSLHWAFVGALGGVLSLDSIFVPRTHSLEVRDGQGQTARLVPLPIAGLGVSAGPTLTFW